MRPVAGYPRNLTRCLQTAPAFPTKRCWRVINEADCASASIAVAPARDFDGISVCAQVFW
ncbi:hypothetical protein BCAR13_120060 [Paraburkholderia caribensis]|nr:hypothetical protein BCAR13_120060 [Paraburkholderia caribensis]